MFLKKWLHVLEYTPLLSCLQLEKKIDGVCVCKIITARFAYSQKIVFAQELETAWWLSPKLTKAASQSLVT